jgi:trimethylamine:corrinoid methyltransferase-like protein
MFLSVSEKDSDCHADCGMHTMLAVKGVGCVRFQLESGVSLEVAGVMYVPGLKLLSVSALEDMGYAIMFEDGQVLIRSEGADISDAVVRLGIREGMIYRLMRQLVVGSKVILDCRSDQSAMEVAGGSSSSEGAAIAATNLMGLEIDPEGGSFRSTFLAKREC